MLDYLKEKKISLLGLGISNRSVIKLFEKKGIDFSVWDDNEGVRQEFTENGYKVEEPYNIDLLIPTPGIPIHNKYIKNAYENNIEIKTDLDVFYENNDRKGHYIGITGTAGKTSTTEIIFKALSSENDNVKIVGNRLEDVATVKGDEETIYVLEMSSFQLVYSSIQFDYSIITNIDSAHTDWHETLKHYQDTKKSIIEKTKKVSYVVEPGFDLFGCAESVPDIKTAIQKVVSNFSNISVENFINSHQGKYSFQTIYQNDNLEIINDGKSSRPMTLNYALNKLNGKDVYVILGGKVVDGVEYKENDAIKNIKTAYLYGESRFIFEDLLKKQGVEYRMFEKFSNAVKEAITEGISGVLLLSPGAPSTDQHARYDERAEEFNNLVRSKYEIVI